MASSATIEWTTLFAEKVAKLDEPRASQAAKALRFFMADTHYGKLNFEKIKGTDYATIRMNKGDRIILKRLEGKHYVAVDIGSHTYIYNKYA